LAFHCSQRIKRSADILKQKNKGKKEQASRKSDSKIKNQAETID
jgi:hypothetical protein